MAHYIWLLSILPRQVRQWITAVGSHFKENFGNSLTAASLQIAGISIKAKVVD